MGCGRIDHVKERGSREETSSEEEEEDGVEDEVKVEVEVEKGTSQEGKECEGTPALVIKTVPFMTTTLRVFKEDRKLREYSLVEVGGGR